MQLQIKANTPLVHADLNSVVQEVVNKYISKLAEDSPEVASQLQDDSNSLVLTNLQVDLGIKLSGQDELQVLTTDARGTEHPELLVVTADMDSSGRLDWETVADNEEQSLFTDAEALIAEGLPEEFTEIDSDYYSDLLDEQYSRAFGDIVVKVLTADYRHHIVIQYYKDDLLVAEQYHDTDNTVLQDVIQQYSQL